MFATQSHDDTKVDLTSGSGLSASPSFVSSITALQTVPSYATVTLPGSGASSFVVPAPAPSVTMGSGSTEIAHLNPVYAAALGPNDDADNTEQVICTAPNITYYGGFDYGDVFGNAYGDIVNYTPAVSGSSHMTPGLLGGSPYAQSSLCQYYYNNVSGVSNPSQSSWSSFIDQATSQVNSMLSANPIQADANIATGTKELETVGAQCVAFVAGAAGIAAANAIPVVGSDASAALAKVITGGLSVVQGVSNYYGCYSGLSNLDVNEQAALHSWGESFSNTITALSQQSDYFTDNAIHGGTAASLSSPSTSGVHAIAAPVNHHASLTS